MSILSIVIPCYNASNFIKRCLESLEQQTRKDFTVIIVDDCSSDDTCSVIDDVKDSLNLDIVLLHNSANSGPAYSRNKGIEKANTKYISFCDADDSYSPRFVEMMISALETSCSEVAFCGQTIVDNSKLSVNSIVENDEVMTPKKALTMDVDSLCSMMVRSEIIKSITLPDIRNGEDVAVVPLIIASANQCVFLSESLYYYYRNKGSASSNMNMNVVDSLVLAFEHTENRMPKMYYNELEYLGLKNMVYPVMITLFSFSYDTNKANKIMNAFDKSFSQWRSNPYFKTMTNYKKVVCILAGKRWYLLIWFISLLRKLLR